MGKVRTLEQLQEILDEEMGWRIKEIGAFRISSKSAGDKSRHFVRAGIALLYAHWEGFIKNASERYLEFVASRGLTYGQLSSCFAVFGLKGKLNNLVESKKSRLNVEAFEFITQELGNKAKLQLADAINTESNLTSTVFANIARSVGIQIDKYETKFNLIDESLVNRRNKVAHGEFLDVNNKEFEDLVSEILLLMRWYKTDIQNAASLEAYKFQDE
ncbi:MAE_28990/MAE_18760 family HEPN-like nuclease [Ruegeria sp. MALMAid1280]|uniref:MAE_28990/MAE_18760 family HEPN-like nuclease n=1 Tax=Ruegeria sp. MALMAid1280 TaxID=3411634 RepID=UPI003BA0E284